MVGGNKLWKIMNMVLELKRVIRVKNKEHVNHELRWYRGISFRPLVHDFFIERIRKKMELWKNIIFLLQLLILQVNHILVIHMKLF